LLGIIIFLKGLKKQLRSDAALDLIFRGALKNLDVILKQVQDLYLNLNAVKSR